MTDSTFNRDDWPSYLTVPEVAGILRVSKMTVYRMVHSQAFGHDGAIQTGRSFRISAKSVDDYLKDREVQPR